MKKVLFAVALLFGAFTASAQVSVVKEAKGMKGNPAQAAKILEAALTNSETAGDPETWKLAGDFQKAIYDAENEKMYLSAVDKSKVADTAKMYNSLLKMFEYYMKCDEIEQAKIASGELKKSKNRKKNADILLKVHKNLVNAGVDELNKDNSAEALKYLGMYVDVFDNPMFAEQAAALKADTMNLVFANYATMAAGLTKNYPLVEKYGKIGKESKSEGWRSLMYMAEACVAQQPADSTKWLEVIKEGSEKFPEQDFFIGHIMDYYLSRGMTNEGLEHINKLLSNKETPFYLYVKGVLLYEKKDYDAAQEILDKVIAVGGDLEAEAYAKKADCYFFPAQSIVEENSSLSIEDPKYATNEDKIKALYEKAKPLYEKAKQIEPQNTQLWGQMLLRIYWKLNKAEYEALEKELGY